MFDAGLMVFLHFALVLACHFNFLLSSPQTEQHYHILSSVLLASAPAKVVCSPEGLVTPAKFNGLYLQIYFCASRNVHYPPETTSIWLICRMISSVLQVMSSFGT